MRDWEEVPLEEVPLVVIDTETTGLYPGLGHRVVEVAAVRFERWQPVGQLTRLVNPGRPIDPGASAVSGITDADLDGQPPFAAVIDDLLALLDDAVLVAHNAAFDAAFLGMEFWLAGRYDPARPRDPVLANAWACTLQLARRHFHFGRNNLQHVAHQLGVRVGRAHRALNDVYMTAEVLKRMSRDFKYSRIHTMGDLLYAQGGAVYSPPPPQVALPDVIAAAVAEQRPLRILYTGDGPARRVIAPRYAALHNGVPQLIAFCRSAQTLLPFRVDQILSVEPA